MDTIEIAKIFTREQIEKEPSITTAIVTGSAARGDAVEVSDIDILLLLDASADSTLRHTKIQAQRKGVFLDAEYVSASKYTDTTMVLKDPYWASAIREAVILYDRDGVFTQAQQVVQEQFWEPQWLQARISSIVPVIQREHHTLRAAVERHEKVEVCRSIIFTLWDICDLLLVQQGISPTWVRGLQRLGKVLPDERDRIIDLEGTVAMNPVDIERFISFFRKANEDWETPFWQDVLRKIGWMICHDLHREAFHSLWVAFGLALRELIGTDEREKQQRAQTLAHAWFNQLRWDWPMIEVKTKGLSEYTKQILQNVEFRS